MGENSLASDEEDQEDVPSTDIAEKKLREWAATSGAHRALEDASKRAEDRARRQDELRRVDPSVLDEPCTV